MKTPSKFASSAYFGAGSFVLFFLLTCFRAQAQVSSEPKDTALVLKKEKATYVPYPIYIDASIEISFIWIGANANAGILLNQKHGIGISIFTGGIPSLGDSYDMSCLGLQYSRNKIVDPEDNILAYFKLEAGKVIRYNWAQDGIGLVLNQNDLKHSFPYYGRITAGIRFWTVNFYAALGSTGNLKTNYIDVLGRSGTHSFNYIHLTLGGGLTLPMHKSKKTSASK